MRATSLAICVALATLTRPALADRPLRLTDVLAAVTRQHPTLAASAREVDVQRGRELAAGAPFEPRVVGKANTLPAGYYEYFQLAATLEQTLPYGGIKLAGGYRLGRGEFAAYNGDRATRSGGEMFASVTAPVLGNRAIDAPRANRRKAELDVARADAELARTRLGLMRDASLRYWEWVAAGHKLQIADDLLGIASERATQIRAQSDKGAIPKIAVVDADRVLLTRQSSLLKAQAEFARAQQKLSLFLRDDRGVPVAPPREQVPPMSPPGPPDTRRVEQWIREALDARPELDILALERSDARVDLEQAHNLRLPTLDVSAFVARDLGGGDPSLAPTEVGVGLAMSVPLWQREGRGRRAQARARLAKLEATERGLRDQIAASIRENAQVAAVAHERTKLARDRLDATRTLADAERERFRQGMSDVLTINLRELDVAAAAAEMVDAELDLHRAAVELVYARGVTAPGPA